MDILNFFLCELTLILTVNQKQGGKLEILARGLQISNVNEIGRLVQALQKTTDRKLKTISLLSGIFLGKTDSVILLGFEYTIYLQNLIKIVRAICEKIRNLKCFMSTTLNFRGRRKLEKKARYIYKRTLDIKFERNRSIGLGSTFGDGQTDRQTHTHYF